MKLKVGNKYRIIETGCNCCHKEISCDFCYGKEETLVGFITTGGATHFVCKSCLSNLNKTMKGRFYPEKEVGEK